MPKRSGRKTGLAFSTTLELTTPTGCRRMRRRRRLSAVIISLPGARAAGYLPPDVLSWMPWPLAMHTPVHGRQLKLLHREVIAPELDPNPPARNPHNLDIKDEVFHRGELPWSVRVG